jgi:DNA (cytosine-5)-methyltransferase 1
MTKPYKMIDLFAGAGGMTQGFVNAGFVPVLAVEKEQDFAATYAENFGKHIVADDIIEVCKHDLDYKADVVIGGPPCQGFSNLTGNQSSDPRREMWRYYMDIVEKTDCKVFVVENVPNLLKSSEGESLICKARKLGFFVGDYSTGILCAADYGVPQNH